MLLLTGMGRMVIFNTQANLYKVGARRPENPGKFLGFLWINLGNSFVPECRGPFVRRLLPTVAKNLSHS